MKDVNIYLLFSFTLPVSIVIANPFPQQSYPVTDKTVADPTDLGSLQNIDEETVEPVQDLTFSLPPDLTPDETGSSSTNWLTADSNIDYTTQFDTQTGDDLRGNNDLLAAKPTTRWETLPCDHSLSLCCDDKKSIYDPLRFKCIKCKFSGSNYISCN